jgi:hypothetical protein
VASPHENTKSEVVENKNFGAFPAQPQILKKVGFERLIKSRWIHPQPRRCVSVLDLDHTKRGLQNVGVATNWERVHKIFVYVKYGWRGRQNATGEGSEK